MRFRYFICLIMGIIFTFLGIFIGLQISPMVGTIILFPLIAISWLFGGGGFLDLPFSILVILFVITSFIWAVMFYALSLKLKIYTQ